MIKLGSIPKSLISSSTARILSAPIVTSHTYLSLRSAWVIWLWSRTVFDSSAGTSFPCEEHSWLRVVLVRSELLPLFTSTSKSVSWCKYWRKWRRGVLDCASCSSRSELLTLKSAGSKRDVRGGNLKSLYLYQERPHWGQNWPHSFAPLILASPLSRTQAQWLSRHLSHIPGISSGAEGAAGLFKF